MSKTWSGQERYADSKRYLENVDAGLAAHVHQILNTQSTAAIGNQLSFHGRTRYALFGSSAAGRAVRALLLCQRAFLGANWAKQTGGIAGAPCDRHAANSETVTKDKYLSMSEASVREAIMAYVALTPGTAALAAAAEQVGNGNGPNGPPYEVMTRAQNPFPSGQVCFNCVYWWLFKSGFVSLRWILRNGFSLGAENANALLGLGTPINRDAHGDVPPIARGLVLNWRGDRPDTKNICHWAVSLGDGYAIGANNSLGGRVGGADIFVRFRSGAGATRTQHFPDSQFGIFSIDDMWKVYAGQKTFSPTGGVSGCILAAIDPVTIPHRDKGN